MTSITPTMAAEIALFGSIQALTFWREAGSPPHVDLSICAMALKTALRSDNPAIRRRAQLEAIRLTAAPGDAA